jgi:hypothetical protein
MDACQVPGAWTGASSAAPAGVVKVVMGVSLRNDYSSERLTV